MMIRTNSAAETRQLGEQIAKELKAGDVILLEGGRGLASGKR